jgi:Rod binding domain-containing protein
MMPGAIGQIAPAATATGGPGSEASKITEAATRLEGVFVSHLVEQMMKSTGISESQPIYSGLLTEKLGDHLASTGSFGLATLVADQLNGPDDSASPAGNERKEKA